MLLFGVVQIVLSQIPEFRNIQWLSILATAMSFTYSSIRLGLGLAKVIEEGGYCKEMELLKAALEKSQLLSAADKVWLVSQALGGIAFANPYPLILIEIQDTLKSSPPENQTMKKASTIAIIVTTLFYLSCGGFGYAAFGDDSPGNFLMGFEFFEPHWLIDFASACVVLHLVGGYQALLNFHGEG
nr:isoform 2 of probable amino acid permease 7 [Quercus suber]